MWRGEGGGGEGGREGVGWDEKGRERSITSLTNNTTLMYCIYMYLYFPASVAVRLPALLSLATSPSIPLPSLLITQRGVIDDTGSVISEGV